MPTIAASTSAMSLTWGSRMKLPTPVKRGATIASTGRYLGTSQLRFDRLHALFVDDADHLAAQLAKSRARYHLEIPWPRQIDAQRGANSPRPVGHDVDHVAEEERLIDVVRDEQHRLAIALPEVRQHLLHDLARQGIQGAEGLVHQQHLGVVRQRPCDRDP